MLARRATVIDGQLSKNQKDNFSGQITLVMLVTKCDSNEPSVIQICNLDNANR